ncbi:Transforming growth factor-beta receptor-associated protein 1 [Neolecta irregularis DAH-3]|uniref:Transforming growth factor-beta receptor-associated protein 1 n=1 Tax=Neolecta irregularis (strain DAH-3) TaxID=1198029 RepID=A0A1U7LR10_NEOID|nr:Transforming growth factor-beta receptor-associated protein 1 [Neolecta irregularis DAH-3]|eukprot:OLL25110.1 Transforming growth factor-beta receptor-associated protein 1 [Neolecta irregularis DAH-3]
MQQPYTFQVLLDELSMEEGESERDSSVTTSTTCAEAYGDHLYVGNTEGQVLHFVVDKESSSVNVLVAQGQKSKHQVVPSYSIASRQKIGTLKKPITNLLLLPQIERAVVLCNNTLFFHTLPNFTPATSRRIKEVNAVFQDIEKEGHTEADGSVSLTVLAKRLIRIVSISREDVKLIKDVDYSGAIAGCQRGSIACVANALTYDLIDVDNIRKIPLIEITQGEPVKNSSNLPLVACVGEDEFLVTSGPPGGDNGIGMFIDMNGDVTRGTLMFSQYPKSIAVEFPFVAALSEGGMIELHNVLSQQPTQVINTSDIFSSTTLCRVSRGCSVTISSLAEKLAMVELRTVPKSTTCQIPSEPSTPLHIHRRMEEIEVAQRISTVSARIFVAGGQKVGCLVTTPQLIHLDELLGNNEIEEALVTAKESFKTLEPGNPQAERIYHELSYTHQKAGFLYLGRTLFDDALRVFKLGNADPRLLVLKNTHGPDVSEDILTELRDSASQMLKAYMSFFREKKGFGSVGVGDAGYNLFRVVDYVLLKILLNSTTFESKVELEDLIDGGVDCFEEAVTMLEEKGRYFLLGRLFESKKFDRDILETWAKLIDGTWVDQEFQNGPEKLTNFLLQCDDLVLIWKYGTWLVERFPKLGISIFMDDRISRSFKIDDILQELGDKSAEAYMEYLEFLVFKERQLEPKYYNELINLYITKILSSLEDIGVRANIEATVDHFRRMPFTKPSYIEYLSTLTPSTNPKIHEFTNTRVGLLNLLQGVFDYDTEAVLKRVQREQYFLLAELIILYGRLNRHAEAIRLLSHDLKDFEGAEAYCLNGGTTISSFLRNDRIDVEKTREDLFSLLLVDYLSLPQYEDRLVQTCRILDRWGTCLDVNMVLEVIPDSWSVDILSGFLTSTLRRLVQQKREIQITKTLRRLEHVNASVALIDYYAKEGGYLETEASQAA